MQNSNKFPSAKLHSKASLTLVRRLEISAWLLATLIISGCASIGNQENWPSSMPPQKIFIESYQEQISRTPESDPNSLRNHLNWVKLFYLGTAIYTNGWNKITAALLQTTEDADEKKLLTSKMQNLGVKICKEWAQDNSVRLIDSAAVVIWGNGLSTAAERNEQLIFVGKVENDVADLLSGKLNLKQITNERYYPIEDFDDF